MQLAYAFTANAAEVTPDNKLWVLGGDFDTITASQFPAVHLAMALVVKLLVPAMECNLAHELRVDLIDSDGHAVQPVAVTFNAQPNSERPGRDVAVSMVLNFQRLEFQRPGDYAFAISVDGHGLGSIPLNLVQVG